MGMTLDMDYMIWTEIYFSGSFSHKSFYFWRFIFRGHSVKLEKIIPPLQSPFTNRFVRFFKLSLAQKY